MSIRRRSAAVLLAATAGLIAAPAQPQAARTATATAVARYSVDAGTTSGMAAMSSGGSGLGAIMGALRGSNAQAGHELVLRLGSTRAATGTPAADHFMPQGAGLGASVPLVTPDRVDLAPSGPGQLPSGRLLLFWGCGEHAPAGQPVVIDFSRLARGQVPAGLYAPAVDVPEAWSVNQANSRTYGDWPNRETRATLPGNASLLGAHRISSNYAPQIDFNLAQDFMPALNLTQTVQASGSVALSWNGLANATGYYAWAFAGNADGSGQARDMVWWASSSTQAFGGPMAEWISPAVAQRLVRAGTVMAPTQTSCTVPAEVRSAGGETMMTSLYGYGPQVDFAYPPRPTTGRARYVPEWIARVRFRSSTMGIVGMPGMGSAGSGQGAGTTDSRPRCRGGLRGMAERAAGLCQ